MNDKSSAASLQKGIHFRHKVIEHRELYKPEIRPIETQKCGYT